MRFYHSGTPRNDKYQHQEDAMCPHRLFSLHGDYLKNVRKWVQNLPRDKSTRRYPSTLLLDSGAFTAWNAGTPTTLDAVVESYTTILEDIDKAGASFDEVWMVNLDVIPGERGRTATEREILDAFKVSDENFEKLNERFKGRVLPVFHQNEEVIAPERLEIVANQSDYICISPRNDVAEILRHGWSLEIHAALNKIKPGIHTHGLATTGNAMIKEVPWFSVDSAAWVLHGGMAGKVDFVFESHFGNHEPNYRNFFFAMEGGKQKHGKHHYKTVKPETRDRMDAIIEGYGFTPELLMKDSRARSLVCMGELSKFFEKGIAWQETQDIPVDHRAFDLT